MAAITWDDTGKRFYETGVDHGVLYPYNTTSSKYTPGVAWNGLTSDLREPLRPRGDRPVRRQHQVWFHACSRGPWRHHRGYTYPDEWNECDGRVQIAKGALCQPAEPQDVWPVLPHQDRQRCQR